MEFSRSVSIRKICLKEGVITGIKKKKCFSRLTGWHEKSSLSAGCELADCTLCELLPWLGKVERQGWVCEGDLDHWGQTETIVSGVV
jgi:hypothetical protein